MSKGRAVSSPLFFFCHKVGLKGIGLITAYHKEVSPAIQPKVVKKEFEFSFQNVDYTLKGKLDLQIPTQRTHEDIDRFLKIIVYVSKVIKAGIFYPNENYFCGICGYKELCKKC